MKVHCILDGQGFLKIDVGNAERKLKIKAKKAWRFIETLRVKISRLQHTLDLSRETFGVDKECPDHYFHGRPTLAQEHLQFLESMGNKTTLELQRYLDALILLGVDRADLHRLFSYSRAMWDV